MQTYPLAYECDFFIGVLPDQVSNAIHSPCLLFAADNFHCLMYPLYLSTLQ